MFSDLPGVPLFCAMQISFLQHLSSISLRSVRNALLLNRAVFNSPPDLDELWRQFTQRFSAFFKKNKQKKAKKIFNGLPPRTPLKPSAQHIFYYLAGLSMIAFSLWIGSGFYMVAEGDTLVLFRWGRYQETISTRGMHWHMPYPVESIESVDTSGERIVRVEAANLMPGKNLPSVSARTATEALGVRATVRYTIQDAAAFLLNNADPEATLAQVTQAALRTLFAARQALNNAPGNPIANPASATSPGNLTALAQTLKESVQFQLNSYKTGVQINGITLEGMQLPGMVRGRIEEDAKRILEERDRQKNSVQHEAKVQLALHRSAAIKLDENAQRYAWRVIAQAQAEAEYFKRLLPAYAKAPSIVRERLYRETLQEIYSKTRKVWWTGAQSAGNSAKNGLAPLIALSIQGPPQKAEPLPNAVPATEQNENTPLTAPSEISTFAPKSIKQELDNNPPSSFKENTILENALFPRSKESLRSRERDA